MEQWLESVYSDGTADFVSEPSPQLGDTVRLRVRMYDDAPVKRVVLRALKNGAEHLEEMYPVRREKGLVWFEAGIGMTERRMQYHFILICPDGVWYYTQNGVTAWMPDQDYDFVLMTDYVQPSWVKEAVFYQIFPERFCNGDPSNDVQSGEYSQDGFAALHMEHWEDTPLDYHQGHCLDFYGGDLQGIRQKIPYLKELGITAVYLNPIFTAPSVHKYDCIDYFHVDPHFGGDEALAELSKALHENGMRLILDISINHTGIAHRWFNRDGAWFPKTQGAYNNPDSPERAYYFFDGENRYRCWWNVSTLPTLNYTSQALRDVIYRAEDSVLKKWLKPPYSIDGWRFDVADVFGRQDELQLHGELWPEIRDSIRGENPEAYLLAEDWGDCAEHLRGDQWDAPMNYYGCSRIIRWFLGEPERFMAQKGLLEGVQYALTAQALERHVSGWLAKLPQAIRDNQFNLIDSHDISRLHNNPAIHPEEYRGAVIFQFMLPGAPSVYYGDEAGIDGILGTNEGCRYPMPWHRDFQSGETYRFYHRLIHLKHSHPALSHGGMKFLCAEGRVLAMARFTGEEAFVAVISAEGEARTIRLPLGVLGRSAPAGETDAFGAGLRWERLNDRSIRLTVPAHQAYLFACQ
ncbi:MAG: alpha-glycosidase [Oscillospiraceae bacterium]|nr:alpha-glycosidase [Oscillospiraceae bacterium]